jgi:hypothetical protein
MLRMGRRFPIAKDNEQIIKDCTGRQVTVESWMAGKANGGVPE